VTPGSMEVPGQFRRSLVIAKKDIYIYFFKGPVLIFGILFPLFLFLAFSIGRDLPMEFLVPGIVGMTVFFTATSVGPVIAPWETRMKTLERLVSAPVSLSTILVGDMIASFVFGMLISMVPLSVGIFLLGGEIASPIAMIVGIPLATFCFSAFGILLSSPPTDTPANVMMLSTFIKFPLIFISGIFISVGDLPTWARYASFLSPLTYFVDIARHSVDGTNFFPWYLDLLALLIFSVLFYFGAVAYHKRSLPKRL